MNFKRNLIHLFIACSFIAFFSACEQVNPNYKEEINNPEFFRNSVKNLTDIIVYDIFSPPVASRVYAYPAIAAYECIQHQNESLLSLSGQLKQLDNLPQPKENLEYSFPLAAVEAYNTVGKKLIFSEDKMDAYLANLNTQIDAIQMPSDVRERSVEFGKEIAEHIIKWSGGDNYAQTRTMPKFSVTDEEGRWQPTPPSYMAGIEPHWNKIRTFVLDSANMFAPAPPTLFSTEKGSDFYKGALEVMNCLQDEPNRSVDEKIEIAKFWDCNPFVAHQTGHVMFATKKITPGGHWMGITDIATKQAESNFEETVEIFSLVSIHLMDAFISCWDEKYRSNLIRPETYINQHIDENWLPALQTPPFPEHTSGHSVISASAAYALTQYYGDNFSYVDSVEVEYGLPVRKFESFNQAKDEAAISRLYGGIHYMPAITDGVKQGEMVGKYLNEKINTRKK